MVYIQSQNGMVLMPTERYGKIRRLLRDGLATVVRHTPFTIRLNYETKELVTPTASVNSKTIEYLNRKHGSVLYQITPKNEKAAS